jgi:O-antigen ligase
LKIEQRTVTFVGVLYLALAIFHIPDRLFRHGFDKDAPAQFFGLMAIAAIFSLLIAIRSERFQFHRIAVVAGAVLLFSQIISLTFSGDAVASLIGDVGRFVGTASTIALLVVSIFHTQFTMDAFKKLLSYYLVAIELVSIAGIAQHFDLLELPGAAGISSTLGNSDFFAAFIGTAFPLILFLALQSSRKVQYLLGLFAVINIYALYLAGPLQGYLDLAFLLVAILLLVIRKYLPRRNISLNARTYLGTFAVIIWAEFIFLMPFLGNFIPVLGNDIQVKIRANFWLAGMRQFFDNPFIGVGPDQYGNYYEQYRTLEDIKTYTNILSNDAHSASVQTLATTGLLGTLAFLFLITLVIRSLLILWDSEKFDRKALFALGAYIFIYLTNSFVSPITLSHKYLFWGICGFIVGQSYRLVSPPALKSPLIRVVATGSAIFALVIATIFAHSQLNFLTHIEKYAADNNEISTYKSTALLPCMMYFDAELLMVNTRGSDKAVTFARQTLREKPRCVAALIAELRAEVNSGDVTRLKPLVYKLYQIAPSRSETISLGMYYANRTGDAWLAKELQREMNALGLTYIPGKLG